MAKNRKDLYVPRTKLQEGIDKCKRNISDFLSEAELLMSENRLNHAVVMVEFGIEEFGKILMLKDAFALDLSDPFKVEGENFYNHTRKSKRAWAFLNPEFKQLYDEGICLAGTLFERGIAIENIEASHTTRCECAFVDFSANSWLLGWNIKAELLQNQINHIRESLPKV